MTAREAALNVLLEVYEKHTYLNLALKKIRLEDVRSQRFTTALVHTVLENYAQIDFVLSRFLDLERTDRTALCICRLGAAQILKMEGVPDRAAVYESVELAKKRVRRLSGFVNGVLRSVLRRGAEVKFPSLDQDPIEYLHVRYSYPQWICALFVDQYGLKRAEEILAYTGRPGTTSIRLARPLPHREDIIPGIYLDDAAGLQGAHEIETDPDFVSGAFTVQSEASMLCVRAAGLRPGMNVLDLCAAPGGKSVYAASLAHPGRVVSSDLHAHRTALVDKTAQRMHVDNVQACTHDARVLEPAWKDRFDVVLVDAPCSALGLLYRKPDIKMFRTPEDLDQLACVQQEILENAGRYVRPGGALVYSTCTIDRKENQDVVQSFLREHPGFHAQGLAECLPGAFAERASSGDLQLLPPVDDVDGFYLARLVKDPSRAR